MHSTAVDLDLTLKFSITTASSFLGLAAAKNLRDQSDVDGACFCSFYVRAQRSCALCVRGSGALYAS